MRIGLMLMVVGFTVYAQDGPERFSKVFVWTGKVTWRAADQGLFTLSDDCSVNWRLDHRIDPVQIELLGGTNVGFFSWAGSTNFNPGGAHVDDHAVFSCPDGTTIENNTTRVDLTGANFVTMLLRMDNNASTYQIGFNGEFLAELTETLQGFTITNWTPTSLRQSCSGQPGCDVWLTNRFPLPASGLVLSDSISLPLADNPDVWCDGIPVAGCGVYGQPGGNLVFSWELIGEGLEVVVELEDYETWLPEGNLEKPNETGKLLKVKATLQKVAGGVPEKKADQFTFELMEVSQVPGVCMNWPIKKLADTELDLRFESFYNIDPIDVLSETMAQSVPGQYISNTAVISCFDFGAYGKLKVTTQVGGVQIVGYLHTDASKTSREILLPKRKPDSKIADYWKDSNSVSSLSDIDDSENDPEGDTRYKGDGLTLYEEYRGFSENLKHVFGNPKKKDFLVCDKIDNLSSSAGIALFTAQSGLEVHPKMRLEEFNNDRSAGRNAVYHSPINFNHTDDERHIVDQHGIIILKKEVADETSYADGPPGGTPGDYERVFISSAAYGWITLDLANGRKDLELPSNAGKPWQVMGYQGAAVVAHELAHTCAVWHHGDTDEREVSWELLVVTNENGRKQYFVRENGLPENLDLRNEGDTPALVAWEGNKVAEHDKIWIGVLGGQHSGDQDCFMRYYCAFAFRSRVDSHVRYIIDDLPGIYLCTSTNGTGINKAQNPSVPWRPRYGDAGPNRGNCKSQICVNDLFMDPSYHQR